jgi:hypothetical protein
MWEERPINTDNNLQRRVVMKMKEWIKAAAIRALRTMAQTAVSLITVGATMSEIDWAMVGSAALLAGILSLLTSIATGLPEVDKKEE